MYGMEQEDSVPQPGLGNIYVSVGGNPVGAKKRRYEHPGLRVLEHRDRLAESIHGRRDFREIRARLGYCRCKLTHARRLPTPAGIRLIAI